MSNNQEFDVAGDILQMVGRLLLMLIAVLGFVLATLTLALSVRGKRESEEEGRGWSEVLLSKVTVVLGLLPILIFGALFLDYRLPASFSRYDLPHVKEFLFSSNPPIITGKLDSKKKSAQTQIDSYQSRVDRQEESLRDHLERKQEEEARLRGASEWWLRDSLERSLKFRDEQIEKAQGELLESSKKLQSFLREGIRINDDLAATKEAQRISHEASMFERIFFSDSRARQLRWIAYIFLFLGFSVFLSYPVEGFLDDSRYKKKGLHRAGIIFERFYSFFSWMWSFPFKKLMRLIDGDVKNSKENNKRELFTDKMRLGKEKHSYLTEKNLNYHVQVVGGSGAGKTNLLKLMIEDRLARDHDVIFFDFKADIELMDWMAGVCQAARKSDELSMVSMSNPKVSHSYNPFKYGGQTEITSQIMNSLTWSESFYRDVAESGLMIIIKALCFRRDHIKKSFDIGDIYSFLTDSSYRMDIISELNHYQYPERFRGDLRRTCEELSGRKKENYQGLINQFSKIINSSAGEILCGDDPEAPEFSFKEVMEKGGVSYLFMNSLRLKETAAIVGKLMLQDLMKTVGYIYDERGYKKRPITLFIDEFASFATPDFGEFIEKARGAGIGVVVAYQSLQSLRSIEGDLMAKLNENTATKIIFQVQDSQDAQWFAGLLGTRQVEKETTQREEGLLFDSDTGMKSIREVEEYIVHPNTLKNLRAGEVLLICSKVDPHYGITKTYLANEYSAEYVRKRVRFSRRQRPRISHKRDHREDRNLTSEDFI